MHYGEITSIAFSTEKKGIKTISLHPRKVKGTERSANIKLLLILKTIRPLPNPIQIPTNQKVFSGHKILMHCHIIFTLLMMLKTNAYSVLLKVIIQEYKNVLTSRTKCLQTEHRTKNSRGIQTSTEHCVKLTGDNLLSILQSDNVFNLFVENYMKVSRCINLSNVSNLLHPAVFQQQIWLGKVFLDMGCLSNLQSTTQMVYDSEWLEFCHIIYHMFGAGVINALHGHGHFSQVTSNRTQKNNMTQLKGNSTFLFHPYQHLKSWT